MKFANVSVQAFKMSHNVPGNFGYVIDTKNGSIMYTSEFVFEQNIRDVYRSSISQLSKTLDKRDIKVLLADSRIAEKKGYTNFAREIDFFVDRNIYGYPAKTFITINSEDVLTLELILQAADKANKKVVILSEKLQSLLDVGVKTGDLGVGKEAIHTDLNTIPEDAVVVTSGNKGYPFEVLESLVSTKNNNVTITSQDQILICLPILATFEKRYADLINQLFKVTENISIIDQKVISEYSARSEDIKMLLSLTQPDYVIPVNGQYRNMNAYFSIMADIQRSEKDVIILTPGQNAEFINGSFKKRNQKVNVKNIRLEDSENPEVLDNILKDRQRMSENGIFVVSFTINNRHEIIDNHIEIVSRGYVETEKYNESMYETRKVVFEYTKECREDENYDWSEYRNEVRNQIGKRLGKINGSKPMIATIISDAVFTPKGVKNERTPKQENKEN
jgi:ribonuclease J